MFIRSLLVSALAIAAMQTHAQPVTPFPSKPVRIIVAFPPGGGTDIVARLLAPKLSQAWGQQIIVENRAGASGVIGTELAARAAPDGYTWLLGTMGNLTVNQHLYPKMPVDPQRDLTALTQVVAVHFVLVAHPSLPAKSVKDLIALVAESGVPGFALTNWFGLAVPAATPRELIARIYGDVSKALAQPDVRDKIQSMGADVIGSAPDQFAAFMRAETEKWAKIVREANIRAE